MQKKIDDTKLSKVTGGVIKFDKNKILIHGGKKVVSEIMHKVLVGETVSSIADAYKSKCNVTKADIIWFNEIPKGQEDIRVYPGVSLHIPVMEIIN